MNRKKIGKLALKILEVNAKKMRISFAELIFMNQKYLEN